MEDIRKQIEEEAHRLALLEYDEDCKRFDDFKDSLIICADFALSAWQEATRWREFGVDDLPKIGQQIVCRSGDKYHLSKPISHDGIHWLAEHFKEWQPINP